MDVGRYQAKRGVAGVQQQQHPLEDIMDHSVSPVYMDGSGGVMLSEMHSRHASESVGNRSSGLLYRPSTNHQPPSAPLPQSQHSSAPPPPPQPASTTTAQRGGRIPERHHYLHVGGDGTDDTHDSQQPSQRGTGLVFTPVQQRTATNHNNTTPAATPINRTSAAADRSTFASMLHTSGLGMTKSHDEELCVILQYLKNYYGQEEDEDVRGLDSMTADDVLALAQCFYLDMFRLLRDKRLERGSPPRHHHHNASNISPSNDPYNSFVWGPTPQHVGVPIHEDLDDIPVTDEEYVRAHQGRVPADVQPRSPRQVAPPSPPRQVPPSPRVAEVQQPRSEYAPQLPSRTASTSSGVRPPQPEYVPQHHPISQDHVYIPPSPSSHATPASATTPRSSAHRLQTPTSRPVPPSHNADTAPSSSTAIRPPPVAVRVNPQPQSVVMAPAYEEEEEDPPQQRPPSVRADQQQHPIHDAVQQQQQQQQRQQRRSESPFDPHEATSRPPPRSVALVPLRTAMPLLQRGTYLIKFALHGGKPQRRYMFLKDLPMNLGGGKKGSLVNVPHLCWSSQPAQAAKEALPLLHLLDVRIGSNDNFKKDRKSGRIMAPNSSGVVRESHCFTLIFNSRSVDVAAEQESDFQLWAGGMLAILKRNEELSAA